MRLAREGVGGGRDRQIDRQKLRETETQRERERERGRERDGGKTSHSTPPSITTSQPSAAKGRRRRKRRKNRKSGTASNGCEREVFPCQRVCISCVSIVCVYRVCLSSNH